MIPAPMHNATARTACRVAAFSGCGARRGLLVFWAFSGKCAHRLSVRTPGFHPGKGGSTPPGRARGVLSAIADSCHILTISCTSTAYDTPATFIFGVWQPLTAVVCPKYVPRRHSRIHAAGRAIPLRWPAKGRVTRGAWRRTEGIAVTDNPVRGSTAIARLATTWRGPAPDSRRPPAPSGLRRRSGSAWPQYQSLHRASRLACIMSSESGHRMPHRPRPRRRRRLRRQTPPVTPALQSQRHSLT